MKLNPTGTRIAGRGASMGSTGTERSVMRTTTFTKGTGNGTCKMDKGITFGRMGMSTKGNGKTV